MNTKTYVIQNTRTLEFVSDVTSMGLKASWTLDQSQAQRLEKADADKKVTNLNSLISGRARVVEIDAEGGK